MEKSREDPSAHIASLSDEFRDDMRTLDSAISEVMGGLARDMWKGKFWGGSDQAIIGYGDYTYERTGKKVVEWFMVGLAAQKDYMSVYVNAVEDSVYLAEKYKDRLGKVSVGKASISFRRLAEVDLDVLLELIAKVRQIMTGPGDGTTPAD